MVSLRSNAEFLDITQCLLAAILDQIKDDWEFVIDPDVSQADLFLPKF